MRRFRYTFDPLFLAACCFYALNRWLIKPHTHLAFFHSWFSDTLLIPCALPVILALQRWLGLRAHDRYPTFDEVFWHWAGWSILFEVIGPHIMPTTGDVWDVVAYGLGGFVSFAIWNAMQAWSARARSANFDWMAPHYRWMEWLLAGRKLQQCRAAFLETLTQPRRVLIVGQGHGRFVEALLTRFPHTLCTCVDSSRQMLEVTRRRLMDAGLDITQVEFIHSDVLDWTPPIALYDLVATHFVLDCFRPDQLVRVLATIRQAAAPDARWLVSDFCEPSAGPAKWRARAIMEMMYLFFQWAVRLPASELTEPDSLLREQGFALRERKTFEWGLLHSDLWQLETN